MLLSNKTMKNSKVAFIWIINILKKHKMPFMISGGLAARIYGSKRPLYDIDIEVPDEFVYKLELFVKDYITFGPKKYLDKTFYLLLMRLNYKEQEIDIGGIGIGKFYNQETKKWEEDKVDFSKAVKKEVFGITAPVISKKELIEYKSKIRRPTDLEDIKYIQSINHNKTLLL